MARALPVLITILLLSGVGYGYWALTHQDGSTASQAAAPGPSGLVVEASPAIRATAVRRLKAVGTLQSNQSVMIRPEIAGRVTALLFENGATVSAGDPLVELDQSVLLAERATAQADLELARKEYSRADQLLKRGTGSRQTRDQTLANLRVAEAQVALIEARLAKSIIVAPFDGRLGIRRIDLGEVLSPGDDIVNLEQITPIKVSFEVPERYLQDIFVRKSVTLRNEAYPGETFEAEIVAVDPRINPTTRGLEVEARARNADGRLMPGQFASVTVRVDQREDATFVPEQALVPRGDSPLVFRIEEGQAKAVPVVAGARIARHVEILDGLTPGDLIVTAGQQRLVDGAAVIAREPTFVPPSPPDEEIQVIEN